MKLAFSGEARHADMGPAYQLYRRRERKGQPLDEKTYRRVLKAYCKMLAERLRNEGMIDLPCGLGLIAAATITRKAQYYGRTFAGYGAMNWKTGKRDGRLKTFGMVYLPSHDKGSLRCYGFVANRKLFQVMREINNDYGCPWTPMDFNDDMI